MPKNPSEGNTPAPEISPGQTYYELLDRHPHIWPDLDEGKRMHATMHAWLILESHDYAAPDDTAVMHVLGLAWQDRACRGWIQARQEIWAKDRRADFAGRLQALGATAEGARRGILADALDTSPPPLAVVSPDSA